MRSPVGVRSDIRIGWLPPSGRIGLSRSVRALLGCAGEPIMKGPLMDVEPVFCLIQEFFSQQKREKFFSISNPSDDFGDNLNVRIFVFSGRIA